MKQTSESVTCVCLNDGVCDTRLLFLSIYNAIWSLWRHGVNCGWNVPYWEYIYLQIYHSFKNIIMDSLSVLSPLLKFMTAK